MKRLYIPKDILAPFVGGVLLLLAICDRAQAQGGTSMSDAIAVPISCGGGYFDDYQDTGYGFYDNYQGYESPEVWYTFTLSSATDIDISTCGSGFDTYLHVLDQYGSEVYSDDDGGCAGNTSLISDNFPAGTYYVVAEGYAEGTGILEISITASGSSSPGGSMSDAISAGTFGIGGGSYTDTRSNAGCMGDYLGQESPEIYYSFTLTVTSQITLSHCGSGFDTYMHLLNSGGTELASNDDGNLGAPCGAESYIETTLGPGTYYVVSEGYSNNTGYIVTTVTVAPVSPPSISYPAPPMFAVGQSASWTPVNSGGPVSSGGQSTTTYATGFYNPLSTATDGQGNVYVADAGNHQVKKISPGGTVSVLAGAGYSGYANGTGTSALFKHPSFLAVDASGNVFVADQQNHRVRKITPGGTVTTFAGSGTGGFANGTGTSASFQYPMGLAFDASGNLFVADAYNHRIRKITPAGVVSTYAGTGSIGATNSTALSSTFNYPMGLAFDGSGNLYVADRQNNMVRKITPGGTVTTLAGSGTAGYAEGTGTSAVFHTANSVAVDGSGTVYLVDQSNNRIRKITAGGVVTTLAGTGSASTVNGTGSVVSFNSPFGMSMDPQGTNLYVAENAANVVRKITLLKGYTVSPALPAGLALNGETGEISGTPTVVSPLTSYTVTAIGPGGSHSATFTIAVSASCLALSQDQNYIVTYTPTEAGMVSGGSVIANSCDPMMVRTAVQYFDGLGRPSQTVSVKGNSDATKDLVVPTEYDEFGRETRKYLPYASATNNGSYKTDAFTAQGIFYGTPPAGVVQTPFPFSRTVFEPSPLDRVTEQGAPGQDWQPVPNSTAGHTLKTEYGVNSENEVFKWSSAPGVHIVGMGSFLQPGELFKTISKDENWISGKAGTLEEFKDKMGRLRLKRRWESESKSLSTYYVYDNLDNLLYVLPPEVTETGQSAHNYYYETDPLFLQYIYAYHYDYRNRVIEKKVPGKGWEYIVYNKMDQMVATQDAEQRKTNQWLVYKYDAMGRCIMTGFTTATRETVQNGVDAQSKQWESRTDTGMGYTEDCWSGSLGEVLTVNYYDSYNFPGNNYGEPVGNQSQYVRGLATATKVKVLGTGTMLLTVNYYDGNGRLVQSRADNHLGGTDTQDLTYTFTGEVLTTAHTHTVGGQTTTIANTYTYDHVGRKLRTTESINGATPIILSALSYSDIGQLKGKSVHSINGGTSYLNSTSYSYNPRGWLKSQSNSAAGFGMSLSYEDGTVPQYNGNISNQVYTNGTSNTFTYGYDKLNRLLSAATSNGTMSEVLTYDDMGNIRTLSRDGGTAGTYSYTGNRLNGITGGPLATGTYQYNDNGNAVYDGRNGMTLEYNYLNLPKSATKTGMALGYTYDATGQKLEKVSNLDGITDYIKGIQYENSAIAFIQTEEGRAIPSGTAGLYNYQYNLTDHLGNVRASFWRNPNSQQLEVLQRDDYYAFGLRKAVGTVVSPENNYLYNGKELQEGIGQYDYGARFYDPVIGRWNVVDPLAEDFDDVSPYNYALNNPILMIDPDGMEADSVKRVDPVIIPPTHEPSNSTAILPSLVGGGLVSNLVSILLEEVVVTAKPVLAGAGEAITTLLSPPLVFIGAMLLPQNFHQEWVHDEIPQNYRPFIPPPPLVKLPIDKAEHTKGARPSTKGKHEKGNSRRNKDRGGEKGERKPPRTRPPGYKGPWPPKNN